MKQNSFHLLYIHLPINCPYIDLITIKELLYNNITEVAPCKKSLREFTDYN